eukprot:2526406-Rhodomonas_salina.2
MRQDGCERGCAGELAGALEEGAWQEQEARGVDGGKEQEMVLGDGGGHLGVVVELVEGGRGVG